MTRRARQLHGTSPTRVRGSIILPAAVAMLVSLVLLASADVGYVFYLKRELQKAADLAAVAGAQRIDVGATGDTCSAEVREAVIDVARRNIEPAGVTKSPAIIRCGHWGDDGLAPPAELGDPGAMALWRLSPEGLTNAVWVRLDLEAPRLMPFIPLSRNVMAHAVAMQEGPVAAFSVGSQLVRFERNSVLGVLFAQIGVDPQVLTVLDGNGLANATITPGGLLKALGVAVDVDATVADVNRLLAARTVSVGELLKATSEVIGQERFGQLGLTVLNNITLGEPLGGLSLAELRVPLGSGSSGRGLFAEIIGPAGAAMGALTANIGLADLVSTLLTVAAFDNRLTQSSHAVSADLLALAGVKVNLRVVEPARIGVGGIGARAYNAQVRASVEIDTDEIPVIKSLLNVLGTRVHLPLHVDLVGGHGELVGMQCQSEPKTVDIRVTSSILNACIAHLTREGLFSSLAVCEPRVTPQETLVRLFGTDVLRDVLDPTPGLSDTTTLRFSVASGQALPLSDTTDANSLRLGSTLTSLSKLTNSAVAQLFAPTGTSTQQVSLDLAHEYLRTATPSGRYDVREVIPLLREGKTMPDGAAALPALGSWRVTDGVPYRCVLGLGTCWRTGDVWLGFQRVITGEERGLVSGVLGTLLGGLLLEDCTGIVSNLVGYNNCVARNLASYLQTDPNRPVTDPTQSLPVLGCSTLICHLLGGVDGVTAVLQPVLDGLGGTLTSVLRGVTGVEIGRTEVRLLSLSCHNARLVY